MPSYYHASPEAGSGAYKKAKELADQNGWFYARQFENEAMQIFMRALPVKKYSQILKI